MAGWYAGWFVGWFAGRVCRLVLQAGLQADLAGWFAAKPSQANAGVIFHVWLKASVFIFRGIPFFLTDRFGYVSQ